MTSEVEREPNMIGNDFDLRGATTLNNPQFAKTLPILAGVVGYITPNPNCHTVWLEGESMCVYGVCASVYVK